MRLKILFTALIAILFLSFSFGQMKMIYGQKHLIFAEIPKDWVQYPIEQVPFFLKPNKQKVDDKTYMYVSGLDYKSNPDLNAWIEGNSEELKTNIKGLKIDTLALELSNLKEGGYLTGRHKSVIYEYPDKRKEILLIVECKFTIVTIVMSAVDSKEFDANFNAFKELAASIKINEAKVEIKD